MNNKKKFFMIRKKIRIYNMKLISNKKISKKTNIKIKNNKKIKLSSQIVAV